MRGVYDAQKALKSFSFSANNDAISRPGRRYPLPILHPTDAFGASVRAPAPNRHCSRLHSS